MSEAPQWPPAGSEPAVIHPDAPGPGTKLNMHFYECFGCGDVDGGLHVGSTVGEHTRVLSQFAVTEAHQGAPGLAHGGLLACAFDEALGAAAGNLLRRPVVTGKLETEFLKPVPVGSTLFIVSGVDGVDGRKVYTSGEGHLDAEDGPVHLRARAIFIQVRSAHFTTHGSPDAIEKFRRTKDEWGVNP